MLRLRAVLWRNDEAIRTWYGHRTPAWYDTMHNWTSIHFVLWCVYANSVGNAWDLCLLPIVRDTLGLFIPTARMYSNDSPRCDGYATDVTSDTNLDIRSRNSRGARLGGLRIQPCSYNFLFDLLCFSMRLHDLLDGDCEATDIEPQGHDGGDS